jgi:cytochrome bd-type quinol oxidase subunit 1
LKNTIVAPLQHAAKNRLQHAPPCYDCITACRSVQHSRGYQMTKQQKMILAAIQARIDTAPNENQRENIAAEYRFFSDNNGSIILDKVSHIIDINKLAKQIAISEKSNSDFIAVYALQKIRKMIYSLANNTKSYIDGYSNSIIFNMVKLNSEITNKSALVALSKSVEYTEFDKVQDIKRTISVAVSTASTQASSTRQMLRVLNIANVTKRKNQDEFTFIDSDIAKQVIAYYQV